MGGGGSKFFTKIFDKFQNWLRKHFGNFKYSVIKICDNFEWKLSDFQASIQKINCKIFLETNDFKSKQTIFMADWLIYYSSNLID